MLHRPNLRLVAVCLLVGCTTTLAAAAERQWSRLPNLPDRHGFAGMYAGVSDGVLLAAGGANFPDAPPWQGGTKIWHNKIFILASPEGTWRLADTTLPRALAYGLSLTVRHASLATRDHRGVVCLGGDDGMQARREVLLLTYRDGKVRVRTLAPLPGRCTQMCGAVVGGTIYIAGGADSLDAVVSRKSFWAADVEALLAAQDNGASSSDENKRIWRELPPWPGAERMQAVAAIDGSDFLLFGGVQLTRGDDGLPTRVTPYLRDAYRYRATGERGWVKLSDIPRPLAAAPCPAPVIDGAVTVFGGVDGSLFTHDQATHPGFTRKTLLFDPSSNRWREGNPMPPGASRVTVPVCRYRGGFAVISGESRPGVRSPEVWLVK